jgi:hypothetical protein
MNDYSNFIYEASNMLDENKCKYLIQYFEDNIQLYKNNTNCIEINNTQIDDPHMYEIINEITDVFNAQFKIYFSKLSQFYNIHPHEFVTSQICIEKQLKEQPIIKKNITTRSSLSYMFFLNNIDNGGDIFFLNDKTIKAEAGKLIFFPKEWFFQFKENIPISNDKYILQGSFYLNN